MDNKIRKCREDVGISQTELAKLAGISRPFLSNIENGTAVPTICTAHKLAFALGKTVDELFPHV